MGRAPGPALRVALPLLGAAVSLCAGLQCVCQLCEHTNFTCQTEGACWASVMLTNGREEVVKSCVSLPELNAQVFCHSSKNITKTECCYTDFCNNITLHLPVARGLKDDKEGPPDSRETSLDSEDLPICQEPVETPRELARLPSLAHLPSAPGPSQLGTPPEETCGRR